MSTTGEPPPEKCSDTLQAPAQRRTPVSKTHSPNPDAPQALTSHRPAGPAQPFPDGWGSLLLSVSFQPEVLAVSPQLPRAERCAVRRPRFRLWRTCREEVLGGTASEAPTPTSRGADGNWTGTSGGGEGEAERWGRKMALLWVSPTGNHPECHQASGVARS